MRKIKIMKLTSQSHSVLSHSPSTALGRRHAPTHHRQQVEQPVHAGLALVKQSTMSMAAALGVEGDVPFAEINGFPTDEIIGVRSGDTSLDLTLPSTAMMPPHEPLIIISRRDR